MSAHAIIAVRGGQAAKSRLSGRLDGWRRTALVEAMLLLMMEILRSIQSIDKIWVVTPTPALADIAAETGALIISDIRSGGLNGALGKARDKISAEFPAATTLLLPGDLPLLDANEVDALLRASSATTIAIATAECDGGTGALALPAQCSIPLAFGPGSFASHIAAAANHGFKTCAMQAPSLSLDIDRHADLDALLRQGATGRIATLLNDWRAAA
ncbi:2-phospho-L-lactate guanylyltransferase [Sphingobium fuliginis]|nr:2-phospho-L-lactate guanylyltransferase [Sphingobium fuliginis]